MCQECVNEGHMTAQELADRLAAGDQSVVALGALEPGDFIETLVDMTLEVVSVGMPMDEALIIAFRVISEYAAMRPDLDPKAVAKSLADRL